MNYGDLVPLPKLVSCIMYAVCACLFGILACIFHYVYSLSFTCPLNFFLHVRLVIFNCVLAVTSVQ